MKTRVAVIGAGWAGCAAAAEAARRGAEVHLFEQSRVPGGRARAVDFDGRQLDNGQHILLGAYRATLQLIDLLAPGRSPDLLLRLPLQMRYPPDSGGMDFAAPRLPAPLHLLAALLRATGLAREDKLALARFSSLARWVGWRLDVDFTVAQLLERWDQTPRLAALMWRPLCIAALNTPPERASARVFLAVLRDSLGARRAASDMLLPRVDLSALLPRLACDYVAAHGGQVRLGATVEGLARDGERWSVAAGGQSETFDRVIVAAAPHQAARLLDGLDDVLASRLRAFDYEAISTCYLEYDKPPMLAQPFYALLDKPVCGDWGQFVFDRGRLDARNAHMLAVVVSSADAAAELPQAQLAQAIADQLARVFARPELARPRWHKVITEKRATFACTPDLDRPDNATGLPGLLLAGDYTAGEYPATLEAAVASGVRAASLPATARV